MKNKACLNLDCSEYKKTKYKSSEKVCPVCSRTLITVCAKKGCYKAIPVNDKAKYCPVCEAEIADNKERAWDNAKKIGSTALGIALTVGGIIFGGKKK
jgi:hypothetical protein